MKNQFASSFMLLGFLVAFLPVTIAQDMEVGKTNKRENVLVFNGDVMKFARENYALNDIPYLEQPEIVKLSRNQWQLVAFLGDHSQIYSFALKRTGKTLLLLPTAYLHICTCKQEESFEGVSFDEIFIIENNKPIGCKDGNHTIAARG